MKRIDLRQLLSKFQEKRLLVVGDIILDKYIFEALPQKTHKYTFLPGGAANTAANVASLGAKAYLIGVIGNEVKNHLLQEVKKRKINTEGVFCDGNRITLQVIRNFVNGKQTFLPKINRKDPIGARLEEKILNFVRRKIENIDAVIITTHARGTVTEAVAKGIINLCKENNKPVIVNAKSPRESYYQNATLTILNYKEFIKTKALKGANSDREIEKLGKRLSSFLSYPLLITREGKGMTLFEKDGKISHIPSIAKKAIDVVGAGDTVTAALGLSMASDIDLQTACKVSNLAASIVIGKALKRVIAINELGNASRNLVLD